MNGKLEIFCGPMNSGKTRELIHRLDRINYMQGVEYLLIKPSVDNRDRHVRTRFGGMELCCTTIPGNEPERILDSIETKHQVIGVEEAQFFDKRLTYVVDQLLAEKKLILISGLDLDFRGESFGPMPDLLARADQVHKLTAVCEYTRAGIKCNEPATRTQRLVNGKPAYYNSPIILVGDKNEGYQARCLKHHFVPGKK